MKVTNRFHCLSCKGCLTTSSVDALRCTNCGQTIRSTDGIIDFVSCAASPATTTPHRAHLYSGRNGTSSLFARIQRAAGDCWPTTLGEAINFGCAHGDIAHAIAVSREYTSLLVLDADIDAIRACRSVISPYSGRDDQIVYATLAGAQDAIRDSTADTIISTDLLSALGNMRTLLTTTHRVLKPGGVGMFVIANRQYYHSLSLAMAEALVQQRARNGVWPDGQEVALEVLANLRQLTVHQADLGVLSDPNGISSFDNDVLQESAREVGFATAEMVPLDPGSSASDIIVQLCQEAGACASSAEAFGSLASQVGRPFFSLLGLQESSAFMLLCVTKGNGPRIRRFVARPTTPQAAYLNPNLTLGGADPRWSIELLARHTADGISISLSGWCLCNIDVKWLRLTLNGVVRDAPVWRPRPDVHEVLNLNRIYHPLNALCSGAAGDLLFEGIHTLEDRCALRLEIVLADGLVVTGLAPPMLVIGEQITVSH